MDDQMYADQIKRLRLFKEWLKTSKVEVSAEDKDFMSLFIANSLPSDINLKSVESGSSFPINIDELLSICEFCYLVGLQKNY